MIFRFNLVQAGSWCLFAFLLFAGQGIIPFVSGQETHAAEFDINGPAIELRRVQFCCKCRKALIVTTIPAGARIQCPNCSTVQNRIPGRYLLTRVYQVCPRCGARMDVRRFTPGTIIKCGTCGLQQQVMYDAVHQASDSRGTGIVPDVREVPASILPHPRSGAGAHVFGSGTRPLADDGPELPDEPLNVMGNPERKDTNSPQFVLPPGMPPELEPVKNFEPGKETVGPTRVNLDESGKVSVLAPSPDDFGKGPPGQPVTAELPAVNSGKNAAICIALVNGAPIYAHEAEKMVGRMVERLRLRLGRAAFTRKGRLFMQSKLPEFRRDALDDLIDRRLLEQEVEQAGIEVPIEEVLERADKLRSMNGARAEPGDFVQEARYELGVDELLRKRMQGREDISPRVIRAYYDQHREKFMQPFMVSLRALVIFLERSGRKDLRPANAIAREIVAKLKQGGNFRDLVYRYSEGPARERGGVMRIGGGVLVPGIFLASRVRDTLSRATPGKVVGPLLLSTCIVFIQPVEIRQPEPLPLGKAGPRIKARMQKRARVRALKELVRELRARAEIRKQKSKGEN